MAIGTDIWKCTYTFALGGDGEQAQTGFHVRWAHADPTDPANAEILRSHIADQWVAAWGSLTAEFSAAVSLSKIAVYHVVPGADTDNLAVNVPTGDQVWAGTGADSLPWECTLCMTLETSHGFQPFLRRKRGRMYLPPLNATVLAADATGFIKTADQTQLRDATLALLEGVNDSVDGTQARTVVYSAKGGFTTDVVYISCDNKIDSQRRRENRQVGWVRTDSADLSA